MEGFPKKETIIELCLDREYTSDIYSPEKRWNFFKSCTIEEVIYSSVFILDKSHILMQSAVRIESCYISDGANFKRS